MRLQFDNTGKRKHPKEADEQKVCWEWLATVRVGKHTLQDLSFMVPNGTQLAGARTRRAQYMASLKAQGFKPGVSDIFIGNNTGTYPGAFIELKRKREAYGGPAAVASAVRKEQKDFLDLMLEQDYYCDVAYGFDEFKTTVENFIANGSRPVLPWHDD